MRSHLPHVDGLEETEHLHHRSRQKHAESKHSYLNESGSEPFSTPPTSPSSMHSPLHSSGWTERSRSRLNDSMSPSPGIVRNSSPVHSQFLQQSPSSWTMNPLYSTSPPSAQSRDARRQASRAARGLKTSLPTGQQSNTATEASPKRTFRSRAQRDAERNNNKAMSPSRSGTDPGNTRVNSRNGSLVDSQVEENNNVINETGLGGLDQTGYIELDSCFPSDAPDHTLMKPSKLRASLRGRRRLTNESSTEDTATESLRGTTSNSPSTTTVTSTGTGVGTGTSTVTSPPQATRHRRQLTIPNNSRGNQRDVLIIENRSRTRSSIATCTANEKLPFVSSSASSYDQYNPAIAAEPVSHLFDSLNANSADALIKPSRMRDSFRRQRNRQQSAENEYVSSYSHSLYIYMWRGPFATCYLKAL